MEFWVWTWNLPFEFFNSSLNSKFCVLFCEFDIPYSNMKFSIWTPNFLFELEILYFELQYKISRLNFEFELEIWCLNWKFHLSPENFVRSRNFIFDSLDLNTKFLVCSRNFIFRIIIQNFEIEFWIWTLYFAFELKFHI